MPGLYVSGVALGALAVGAALAALLRGPALAFVYPLSALAAVALGVVDLQVLLEGGEAAIRLPIGLPTIGFHLRLDTLSAFFGIVINGGVVAASVYGMGFDRAKELTPRIEPLFPLFAAAMNLVLIADDAYAFLFSWELMSLTSWALVVARHTDPECRRAAHLYLVMAAIGTVALLFAFGGLAGPAGGYGFDTMRAHPPQPMVAALVLTAALIGCGSKGGLIPLHAWLPLAHPAAPSHVSALMSGVMTKVAIYGFVRIAFDLLGPPAWWWALPPIILGAVTAVLGLLYAVLDRDLKRVLAYSTIENVGLIFVALGLALAFRANAQHEAAAVAMAAALLHVLNHSWFKSLLFLGAGAILHATGRRDLDGLGGLIHRMPRTAAFFLVGALAISALPPLNGFVSEWLLFQAVIAAPALPQAALHFASPAIGAMLALAAALAAACFVRVYGTAFLGRPRSAEAAGAHDVPLVQQAAMGGLALLCILGGLMGSVLAMALSAGAGQTRGRRAARPRQRSHAVLPDRLRSGAQHLRRAGHRPLRRHRLAHHADRGPPAVGAPDPPRPGLGLRLSRPVAGHPVHRLELRPAAAPRVRRRSLLGAGDGRHAASRRYPAGALLGGRGRSFVAGVLRGARPGRPRPVGAPERLPVPHHPALPRADVRHPRHPAVDCGGDDVTRDLVVQFLAQGAQMTFVLLIAPLAVGVVRRVKARLMRRQGPPLLQAYLDLAKLLRKESVIAESASWLFRSAPYLIFALTWVAAALVPTFASGLMFNWAADVVALVALLGAARALLALAGMDVGTSFGGIGSSREMMIATLAEPAMMLIVLTLAIAAGTTRLAGVADFFIAEPFGVRVSLALSLIALVIVALAENARIPVDNPATHLELTMVHEAMVLEYSGRHLALIEAASHLKLVLYISLLICLFAPFGMAPATAGLSGWAIGLAAWIAKLLAGAVLLGVWEVSIAKMRVFRLPDFVGIAFVFGFLAILLAFLTRGVFA